MVNNSNLLRPIHMPVMMMLLAGMYPICVEKQRWIMMSFQELGEEYPQIVVPLEWRAIRTKVKVKGNYAGDITCFWTGKGSFLKSEFS